MEFNEKDLDTINNLIMIIKNFKSFKNYIKNNENNKNYLINIKEDIITEIDKINKMYNIKNDVIKEYDLKLLINNISLHYDLINLNSICDYCINFIKNKIIELLIEVDDRGWITITKDNVEEITNQLNNEINSEIQAEKIIKQINNIIDKGE